MRHLNPIFTRINTVSHIIYTMVTTHTHIQPILWTDLHTHTNNSYYLQIAWNFGACTFGKWISLNINNRLLAERKRPLVQEFSQAYYMLYNYAAVQISRYRNLQAIALWKLGEDCVDAFGFKNVSLRHSVCRNVIHSLTLYCLVELNNFVCFVGSSVIFTEWEK